MSDVHSGHRARMRSRFAAQGLDGFADHEVLELILFYAIPQGDVNDLAHELIERFGTIAGVLDASVDELKKCADIITDTDYRMQQIAEAVNLLRDE